MVYCDAPGAALIGIIFFILIEKLVLGINKGEEYLEEQGLFEEYPSCTFICLDEEKMFINSDNNLQSVSFNGFERPLINSYTKLNSNFTRKLTETRKSKPSIKRESIKISEDNEEREKSLAILELFKVTLEKKLICHIPEKPIYKSSTVTIFSLKKFNEN